MKWIEFYKALLALGNPEIGKCSFLRAVALWAINYSNLEDQTYHWVLKGHWCGSKA